MKQHTGIVLKQAVYGQGIIILDHYLGKIKGTISGRTNVTVSSGTVITYTLPAKRSWYVLENIELAYIPFASARDDIFFLHHLLELCYYFLPEECAVDEVFQMLIYLMYVAPYEKVSARKCCIVARLLMLFGLYPEHAILCKYLQTMVALPLDLFFDAPYSGYLQHEMQQWVWSCIMTHPHRRQFKTLDLLKKAESHEH